MNIMLDHVEKIHRRPHKRIPNHLISTLPNVINSASINRYKHLLLGHREMSLPKVHAGNRTKCDTKP